MTTKKAKSGHKPNKALVATTMKAGAGRSLQKVKAVMVKGSSVKLFVNCEHTETLGVTRHQGLQFDPASSLYIGQGGPGFKKPWEGVLQVKQITFIR